MVSTGISESIYYIKPTFESKLVDFHTELKSTPAKYGAADFNRVWDVMKNHFTFSRPFTPKGVGDYYGFILPAPGLEAYRKGIVGDKQDSVYPTEEQITNLLVNQFGNEHQYTGKTDGALFVEMDNAYGFANSLLPPNFRLTFYKNPPIRIDSNENEIKPFNQNDLPLEFILNPSVSEVGKIDFLHHHCGNFKLGRFRRKLELGNYSTSYLMAHVSFGSPSILNGIDLSLPSEDPRFMPSRALLGEGHLDAFFKHIGYEGIQDLVK